VDSGRVRKKRRHNYPTHLTYLTLLAHPTGTCLEGILKVIQCCIIFRIDIRI